MMRECFPRLVVRRATAPFRRLVGMVRQVWRRCQSSPSEPDSFGPPLAPGLDCPQCDARLTVTIQMLLSGSPVRCYACGLVLRVDREESRECLDRLAELKSAIDRANAAAGGYKR